tara:strand:+ start:1133 stop:1588 length:456 start_codon:yes stop_codon:yes gene_type:complete
MIKSKSTSSIPIRRKKKSVVKFKPIKEFEEHESPYDNLINCFKECDIQNNALELSEFNNEIKENIKSSLRECYDECYRKFKIPLNRTTTTPEDEKLLSKYYKDKPRNSKCCECTVQGGKKRKTRKRKTKKRKNRKRKNRKRKTKKRKYIKK